LVPFDQDILILPTEDPWPKFVIPEKKNLIIVSYMYLLTGQIDDRPPMWAYLYDCELEALPVT
jgi:hypothetical protein